MYLQSPLWYSKPPSSKVFTRVTPVECLHYIPNLEKYFVTGDAAFARVAQKKIEFKFFIRLCWKKGVTKERVTTLLNNVAKKGAESFKTRDRIKIKQKKHTNVCQGHTENTNCNKSPHEATFFCCHNCSIDFDFEIRHLTALELDLLDAWDVQGFKYSSHARFDGFWLMWCCAFVIVNPKCTAELMI